MLCVTHTLAQGDCLIHTPTLQTHIPSVHMLHLGRLKPLRGQKCISSLCLYCRPPSHSQQMCLPVGVGIVGVVEQIWTVVSVPAGVPGRHAIYVCLVHALC